MSKNNIIPLNKGQVESKNRLSFTLEEMLEEFDNGAVPRSKYWKELITALYDTANHVVTGVTSVADVRPDNLGNIPLLPKDIDAPPMVRMEGADERERQSTEDVFGRQLFYGDACKVVHQYGHYYEVLAGTGYVAGIKFSYPGMQELLIDGEELPTSVWVDVSLYSTGVDDIKILIEVVVSNQEEKDYIKDDVHHFLEKISELPINGQIIDLRVTNSGVLGSIVHATFDQAALDKNEGRDFILVGEAPYTQYSHKVTEKIGSFIDKSLRRWGVVQDETIRASDFVFDYNNPSNEEIEFLANVGKIVMFKPGVINTAITINLKGNTIWKAYVPFSVTVKAKHSGYVFHTVGNNETCGTDGINYDGVGIAESIVQFSECNNVICKNGKASNILKEGENNYRGAWIFLNVKNLEYGSLYAENILQTPLVPPHSHGQYQSFSFNNVDNIAQIGFCYATSVDKMFHTDGTTSGDAGTFIGKDIQDNVSYFLGTPNALIVNLIADGFSEAIVYNVASDDSSVYIPYCNVKNGTSRLIGLRTGGGLKIGKFIGKKCRNGIFDQSFDGVSNVYIDDFNCEEIEEERALTLSHSDVTINRFNAVNVKSSLFNEVARVMSDANFSCSYFKAFGGNAITALRVNELTTGKIRINSIDTDKENKVVYQSGIDFGGKSKIDRINGFLIDGGAPSTLIVVDGEITVTQNSHRIDIESGESLHTINGAFSIDVIITLQTISSSRPIIIKHNIGNIWLPNGTDIELNYPNNTIQLKWNGTYWSKPV